MLESLATGAAAVCNPLGILLILLCTAAGIIFGSIPGLSATMAIALFLPVSYGMTPLMGMTMLVSVYIGGVSGGLISAILLKMPGTPSSVATCFDGYPLTQKGQGIKALGVGVFFSFLGTLFSIVALIAIAPNLATLALKFGDFEYFSIAVFSLTMIASLSSGSMVKGLLSGFLGVLLTTVGMAPIDAAARFTFGSTQMGAGLDILPVLIGMFALSEIMVTAETSAKKDRTQIVQVSTRGVKGFGFSVAEGLGQWWNALRSALIGLAIGILPGLGGSTSNLIAYTVAKNQSSYPEKFGTGIIDGVVATETSNNASVGGAMIPLLTLGIPGDMATAMLLGGLMIHGLQPGPLLFTSDLDVVGAVMVSYFLANIVMCVMELGLMKVFVRAVNIPFSYLFPAILMFCVLGTFALNNRTFDLWILIVCGILAYVLTELGVDMAPVILGYILGPLVEKYFRMAMTAELGNFGGILQRPIAVVCLIVAILFLVLPLFSKKLRDRKNALNI